MPEWISVDDKLPELGKEVLAYCAGRFMEVARLDFKDGEKRFLCMWDSTALYRVTHWMPLPEPPQEERL